MWTYNFIAKLLMFSALTLLAALLLAELPGQGQDYSSTVEQKSPRPEEKTDENQGPVVDYDSDKEISALSNSREYTLRRSRASHYDKREATPIGEWSAEGKEYGILTHWEIGLPPIPVIQSDAIVLGEVISAQAYLSNDKAGVYSEFTIRVEKIFKNYSDSPLKLNNTFIAEREGGVVRFSSGRLLRYFVFYQGLPRINRRYVFFLSINPLGEDYRLVTAYNISKGHVFPLDEPPQFASYQNTDVDVFMNAVREAVANPSQTKTDKER